MKLCIITNILAPYRLPLFEKLSNNCYSLDVLLMAKNESNRSWEIKQTRFKTTILPGIHLKTRPSQSEYHFNIGAFFYLMKKCPDVVISGGFTPANLSAFIYCLLFKKKYVVWGEMTHRELFCDSLYRKIIRNCLIGRASGGIASTSLSSKVFSKFGLSSNKILTSLMPIDVPCYRDGANRLRRSKKYNEFRLKYSSPILITIGRLTDLKGYWDLFCIYEILLAEYSNATLLILGDGPQKCAYQKHIRKKAWKNVFLLGFQQSEKLIEYLTISDLFIFPTHRDSFGAVISEAMSTKTPVLASENAAAVGDLIHHGQNGFVFNPKEHQKSALLISKVLSLDKTDIKEITDRALSLIETHTFETEANSILSFLNRLTEKSDKRG